MLRELGTLCLAPVVMIGYMLSTDLHISKQSQNKTEVSDAGIIEVMSCETGLGGGVKASSNGFYGVDIQYGFTYTKGGYSASFIPKLGLSAVDHTVKELPQGTQFGLGAQILLGYDRYRVGLELWHLSNGSALGLALTDKPNIGLNLPIVQVGMTF